MRRNNTLLLLAIFGMGCGQLPEVTQIDALEGESVVATIADDVAGDAVFEEDLPVGVSFDVTFTKPMSITSAQEHIWIEDETGGKVDVEIDGRLSVLTVIPSAVLAPESNHLLVIEAGTESSAGKSMLSGYNIAFYTAAEAAAE